VSLEEKEKKREKRDGNVAKLLITVIGRSKVELKYA